MDILVGTVDVLVSPASPEKAIRLCLFNALVLSSEALRIVAPLMAALEVQMMVKSLPVIPSNTSLEGCKYESSAGHIKLTFLRCLMERCWSEMVVWL